MRMSQAVQCQMLTWEQIYHLARLLSRRIRESNYRIDLMVAIGRGGYIPARILSDMLGVSNLTGFKIEHYRDIRKTQQAVVRYPLTADVAGKNVLLVDDVTDTGDTFDAAIEHIRQRGAFKEIRTAALIHKTVSRFVPDYYADCLAEWRWQIFPWAVNEDLSALIGELTPVPSDLSAIRSYLSKTHGFEASFQQIEDALLLIEPSLVPVDEK